MPLKFRRKPVPEKKGTRILKPITDKYIRSNAGMAGTNGKLLKALMEEKAKERGL